MKIDISRVNLLEKDIEDWLYENPGALLSRYDDNPIVRWIGRQYTLPSGIADLIGVRQDDRLVVVEVKNVAINKAAVLQVCRYQTDLQYIVSNRMEYPHIRDWNEPVIDMVLVGPSIDGQTFTEAQAVGVQVFSFSASLELDLSSLYWSHDQRDALAQQREEIARRPEWGIYGITIKEDVENFRKQREAAANNELFQVISDLAHEYKAAQDASVDPDDSPDESNDS